MHLEHLSSESADTDEEPSEFEGFESDDGGVFSSSEFIPDKYSSSDEETAVEICDCGKAHKRDCPLNPRYRNAYSGKQKKQGTKKEQSSLSVRKGSFAIGTKGKGRAATVRQSEAPSSNPPRRKRLFQKELYSHSLSLQSSAKRVCLPQRTVDPDSDCLLTEYEPFQDIVHMNPPDREWKEETMRYLERWTETSLEYKDDGAVIKVEIYNIAPHQVDAIEGDGHCFFRAISKAVTGSQKYHTDFRKAVVEWMLCKDHPPQLAQYIAPFDAVSDSDGQLAIQKYIDEARMSLDGWGGDKEIRAFATMFQVDICVSNNSRGGRRWNYYPPLFYDEKNCRRKSDYKL